MPSILGVNVVDSSYQSVVANALAWSREGQSRTLAFANVHVIMEAYDSPSYRECLERFDMVNPDGVPLVWALKRMGYRNASRVYGPDCTVAMLAAAAEHGVPVGFYGGSPQVLERLLALVQERFPELSIPFAVSPPFRQMTSEEDAALVEQLVAAGPRILFVGLGCPKQERWIIEHLNRVPAVMFGVGAAFDFIAGTKRQAPRWMMRNGLEWVFRFGSEPKRLASRYLKHNPRFLWLVTRQLLRKRAT